MDALRYLDVWEARLASESQDGRLEKVIAKLDWVADEFTAMRQRPFPVRADEQHARLVKIAALMDEVSDCMSGYLTTDPVHED